MYDERIIKYPHFTTIWKAFVLIRLLAGIEEAEIHTQGKKSYGQIKDELKKHGTEHIFIDDFSPFEIIERISSSDEVDSSLSAGLSGFGCKLGAKRKNDKESQVKTSRSVSTDQWIFLLNILKEKLKKLRLVNNHYLFIDGIDTKPPDIEYSKYSQCIYPLVRAVYEINNDYLSCMEDRSQGRLQVVLLTRLDIFQKSGLPNPECKLSDNSAFLDWGSTFKESEYERSDIFNLIQKIIVSCTNSENDWNSYFNFSITTGAKKCSPFEYFSRYTALRPRDFIKLLEITKRECEKEHIENPTPDTILSDDFKNAFSNWYLSSIRTALSFFYNETQFKFFVSFLKTIHQTVFSYQDFQKKYNAFSQKKALREHFNEVDDILELLFSNNMICYIESNGNMRWKHRETSVAMFDYKLPCEALQKDAQFKFHPALEKTLTLYE